MKINKNLLPPTFRQIMITLLKMIESQNQVVMIAALQTLSKIIRSPSMRPCWTNFLELILLKIIDSYKSGKEVSVFLIL